MVPAGDRRARWALGPRSGVLPVGGLPEILVVGLSDVLQQLGVVQRIFVVRRDCIGAAAGAASRREIRKEFVAW